MKKGLFKNLFVFAIGCMLMVVGTVCASAQKYNKYSDSYYFRKGLEALDERDYAKAEAAFNNEVGEHEQNGYAYLYLAHLQWRNDQYGKALMSIDSALKYIPKKDKEYRGMCHYKRAGIYDSLEKYDEAIADYTIALSYNPKDEDSYWERAQLYYEQEKYDLADADYKKMAELEPNSPLSYMGLGRNENARGNYQSAIDLYDNVVALYPEYASGYSFRAEAYFNAARYIEAASDVVTALDLDYDNKAFGLMVSVADSAFVQMNAKLKAAAVNDSNNGYWPYCIGVINESTKRYEDAITNYLKAAKLDEDAITYKRISVCYQDMGNWSKAAEYMDKAITLDPKDYNLLMDKADIYYESGNLNEAIAILDEYIELAPDYPGGYYARGWYKDNLKDIDGAIEDYTTAITLEPEMPYAIMSRGNMYLLKGETDLAMKDFEAVVQMDTVPEYGSCTMYALMHLGRNEEAIEWMDKMLADSDEEGVYYEAACLYSLMGETDKALGYLEESLKRGNKSYHHIMTDDDIDNLKSLEAFTELLEKYFPKETSEETVAQSLVEYNERVVEIPFTRVGGVTQVKCSVNGLPLHFIFDTGAADVSISRVEATFMFKNEYLTAEDVVGKARYTDANGDISIGTVLNIKKITFGGLELENVRASVVETNNAPLLLGQSVLNRLGKIEIDYERSVLKITTKERLN